jgi:hypothetical protein
MFRGRRNSHDDPLLPKGGDVHAWTEGRIQTISSFESEAQRNHAAKERAQRIESLIWRNEFQKLSIFPEWVAEMTALELPAVPSCVEAIIERIPVPSPVRGRKNSRRRRHIRWKLLRRWVVHREAISVGLMQSIRSRVSNAARKIPILCERTAVPEKSYEKSNF